MKKITFVYIILLVLFIIFVKFRHKKNDVIYDNFISMNYNIAKVVSNRLTYINNTKTKILVVGRISSNKEEWCLLNDIFKKELTLLIKAYIFHNISDIKYYGNTLPQGVCPPHIYLTITSIKNNNVQLQLLCFENIIQKKYSLLSFAFYCDNNTIYIVFANKYADKFISTLKNFCLKPQNERHGYPF